MSSSKQSRTAPTKLSISSPSLRARQPNISPRKSRQPPVGLQLGTVIHPTVPSRAVSDVLHSPDPLALSGPDEGHVRPRPSTSELEVEHSKKQTGAHNDSRSRREIINSSEAGPSSLRNATTASAATPTSAATPESVKGKGKAPERRVLPARIRRAAGGGVEGMRDVEDMIMDWLERWGEPQTTPPDDLAVHLTSIPLDLVDPPTSQKDTAQPPTPIVTLTPTRRKTDKEEREAAIRGEERIETPSWSMVTPEEDDRWEAKEELEILGKGKGKAVLSPVKRLRRGVLGDEFEEDTSDAYYTALHKKYETFERRQRIREKEKLQFERYKMRSRIDLLRNMSKDAWASVVATILSRGIEDWEKGKKVIEERGTDWLKKKLVKEGEEVMKRYEELLPPEQRKHKDKPQSHITQPGSRLSTPSRPSKSLSLTPPPAILPARVVALRDPVSTSSAKRKRRSSVHAAEVKAQQESPSQRSGAAIDKPTVKSRALTPQGTPSSTVQLGEDITDIVMVHVQNGSFMPVHTKEVPSVTVANRSDRSPTLNSLFAATPNGPRGTGVTSSAKTQTSISAFFRPIEPKQLPALAPVVKPILTVTGLPCLIEAANRRESAQSEVESSKLRAEAPREGRLIAREKTRASRRLEAVSPFGMPVPSVVEYKSEFNLTDEEDFWPIIAARQAQVNQQRTADLLPSTSSLNGIDVNDKTNGRRSPGDSQISIRRTKTEVTDLTMTPEEVEEMEGVEAAVVL